ncbi:MAG: M6 family metalloprotease domain-containing protein [Muribaculaceae bacterium]|nr:M6 family metalloprotease domain-containing protein [Muribaculaceae bacterium]
MMKRIFTLVLITFYVWVAAMAIPAKRGFQTYTQSDGSQISVQAMGDEFFHFFVSQDGLPVGVTEQGDFHYMTATGVSSVMAHNVMDRNSAELSFIEDQRASMKEAQMMPACAKARQASARPRKAGKTQVPTLGSPRVPILLVQYTDKKMCHTMTEFETQYKNGAKSVYQYFVDQSNGKFTPQYDLYGIYDLPQKRAYYGGNQGQKDSCVATMVCHAIDVAGDDIDWSRYDNDGDGEADVCVVVYAGVGEAQATYTVPSSIWPCQWNLETAASYGDGTGPKTLNGVTINRFAVFNEISGKRDDGTIMDGIGTFCHEFSHCLGLPDFYATNTSFNYGMSNWSLMDYGSYNGGSVSGDTPIGYSAYEKNFMGWLDYIIPVNNTHYTLPVFNNKSEETDQAIQITSHLNKNEYYILENRRQQGWDQYIPDEGVLITHFTYIADRWEDNTPNNYDIQLATVVPADNLLSKNTENADCYGENNHELTPTSTPAMTLNMGANGQLASSTGGAGTLNKPVTDIILNSDGTASLWYFKADLSVTPDSLGLRVAVDGEKTATFNVKGKDLPSYAVLTVNDESNVFTIDKTSLTTTEVEQGVTVTVTFKPTEITTYAATIDVTCEGMDTLTVTLAGEGLIESETPVMQPADTTAITPYSFRADWTDGSPVENVKSYTLYVNYKPQYVLLYDNSFTNWQDVSHTNWYWTDFTDISSDLADYGLQGWTGEGIFSHQGYMQIGDQQVGYNGYNLAGELTTPAINLTDYDGNVTIVADAKAATDGTNLTIAVGQETTITNSQSVAISTTANTYTQVLQGNAVDNAFVRLSTASGQPVQLTSLKIYAGEYSEENAKAPLLAAVESGDSLQRVIEGITDLQYTVSDLKGYGTFNYYVEAVYINETHSDPSNIETVTLRDAVVVALRGDVNNDGVVDIADVNIVINIMLGKDSADNYDGRAYITHSDTTVDIADVNAVINLMLGKIDTLLY